MNGFAQFLVLPGTVMPGGQNVGTDRKTQEQVGQEIDKSRVGANGRQGVVSGIAAYDHYIRRVEQQLEHGRKGQGYGKAQQLRQNRAIAHIDLITFC